MAEVDAYASPRPTLPLKLIPLQGTYRTAPVEETWALISTTLHWYGITRVADVTGLDVVGLPVAVAVRPLAATLSVSQGKGHTAVAAKVSAAMEAMELWHAENAIPAAEQKGVSARDMGCRYQVNELEAHPGALVSQDTPLDWIPAVELATGTRTSVPRASVQMGRVVATRWWPTAFTASSNGLASGNTYAEACSHAMLELIERDALCGRYGDEVIDLGEISDENCAGLVAGLLNSSCWVEAVNIPNRWGVPCVAAFVWAPDGSGVISAGSGAHPVPEVALGRALTEAAQTRLTVIVGTRDDLSPRHFRGPRPAMSRPKNREPVVRIAEVARMDSQLTDDRGLMSELAALFVSTVGCSPLAVDLSTRSDLAVVKVQSPGLRFALSHDIPRFRD